MPAREHACRGSTTHGSKQSSNSATAPVASTHLAVRRSPAVRIAPCSVTNAARHAHTPGCAAVCATMRLTSVSSGIASTCSCRRGCCSFCGADAAPPCFFTVPLLWALRPITRSAVSSDCWSSERSMSPLSGTEPAADGKRRSRGPTGSRVADCLPHPAAAALRLLQRTDSALRDKGEGGSDPPSRARLTRHLHDDALRAAVPRQRAESHRRRRLHRLGVGRARCAVRVQQDDDGRIRCRHLAGRRGGRAGDNVGSELLPHAPRWGDARQSCGCRTRTRPCTGVAHACISRTRLSCDALKGLPVRVWTLSLKPASLRGPQGGGGRSAAWSVRSVQQAACLAGERPHALTSAADSSANDGHVRETGTRRAWPLDAHLTASCTSASMLALSASASTMTLGLLAHRLRAVPRTGLTSAALPMAAAMLRSSAGLRGAAASGM